MSEQPFTTIGDEALEARIVAWVLGEASSFEIAELERLCAERPELLIFQRRMKALHGLIGEAEAPQEVGQWKLSPAKRAAVEQIFDDGKPLRLDVTKESRIRFSARRAILSIAACFVITVVVWQLMPRQAYVSQAVLEIRPSRPPMSPLGIGMSEQAGSHAPTAQFFGTEFEKIKSRESLEKVVDNLNLAERWGTDKEQAINELKKRVETENIRGTDLMAIRVKDRDKATADEIAREVTFSYQRHRNELEAHQAEEQLKALNKVVREQEDRVEERRKVLATIAKTKSITYAGETDAALDTNGKFSANQSGGEKIRRGLDAQDYAEAKREFETEQKLLEEIKIKAMGETIARKIPSSSVEIHELPGGKTKSKSSTLLASKEEMKPLNTDFPEERIEGTPTPMVLPKQTPSKGRTRQNESLAKKAEDSLNTPFTTAPPPAARPAEDGLVMEERKVTTDRESKPSAPRSSMAKAIISSGSETAIPVPDVDVTKPSLDFGDGDQFGTGWGDASGGAGGGFTGEAVAKGNRSGDGLVTRESIDNVLSDVREGGLKRDLAKWKEGEAQSLTDSKSGEYEYRAKEQSKNKGREGSDFDSSITSNSDFTKDRDFRNSGSAGPASRQGQGDNKSLGMQPAFARAGGDDELASRRVEGAGEKQKAEYWAANEGRKAPVDPASANGVDPFDMAEKMPSAETATASGTLSLGANTYAGLDKLSAGALTMEDGRRLNKNEAPADESARDPYWDTSGVAQSGKSAKPGASYEMHTGYTSEYLFRGVDLGVTNELDAPARSNPALADEHAQNVEGESSELVKPKEFDGVVNYGSPIVADEARSQLLADVVKDRETSVPAEKVEMNKSVKAKKKAKPAPLQPDLTQLIEEIPASEEPYSTFSLNISDTSFRIAQAALAKGERPDPAGIKVEQFYNAVNYGDPAPAAGQPVACLIEQSAHPVIPGRNLVRVALKTAAAGRSAAQPLRLTLLVDQSGSMSRADRSAAMESAMRSLGTLLTDKDLVTVIGFSRKPRLLADGMKGSEVAPQLAGLVNQASSEGGTNLELAIKLAEEKSLSHKLVGAQNRIVLFTDGAANLGDADPERLAAKVEQLRQQGIAFDIAGIAADDLNDELLAELARKGNGRYSVVGKGEEKDFAKQLAGAFRPAAENVKVQVRFNPERVKSYKLIGFEKDRLKTEDFRNDAVDAAELAAEEAGVAIYQVEPIADGRGEIGEVSVRFRDTSSGEMVERMWTMTHNASSPAVDRAAPSMQLAVLALLAGEKLKGGPLADAIDFKQFADSQATVKQAFANDTRIADILRMVDALK